MQTKSRDWLAFLFGEYLSKLTISKRLYAATGLLILASVLLVAVASVIQEKGLQHNGQKEVNLPAENSLISTAVTSNVPSANEAETEAIPLNEAAKRPVKGDIILAFGWQQHPVYKDWRYHTGIDIGTGGKQDVQAVFSGKVIDIYTDKHNGLTVVAEGKDYKIFYGSLSKAEVTKDSYIKSGQYIGKTGVSREEPDEHLHLAIKKEDHYINPADLF